MPLDMVHMRVLLYLQLPDKMHFDKFTTRLLSVVFIGTNHLDVYLFISSPDIPLANITKAHLVAYDPDKDFLPMILANCDYSLKIGEGTIVEFNWKCLERQLVDRFIRGRPRLTSLVKTSILIINSNHRILMEFPDCDICTFTQSYV